MSWTQNAPRVQIILKEPPKAKLCMYYIIIFFGIMVYLGKQIKISNMLQKRAVGVEEKRRRLGRLRRERSTLAAVSRGDRLHSYCDVWGVGGWGDRAASASSGYWVASWTSSRRTS